LVYQWDSSAYRARSLQNVPVWPPIAHSTPSFFCTFLRISHKISISQRLRARSPSDTDWNGSKSQDKQESRICTELAVGKPIERLRFVLSSCLQVLFANGWPFLQEPYSHYTVKSVRVISTVDITGPNNAPQVPRERGMWTAITFMADLLNLFSGRINLHKS